MINNSEKNKRIAKNTLFLYIRMIFVLLVSLYTTRVVINVLGILDYGIFSVVSGFVSMFLFLNTSMVNSTQRYYNFVNKEDNGFNIKSVYTSAVVIHFIISIVTVLLLEIIGIWYINNKMIIPADRMYAANWIFQLSIFSLVFNIMQNPYIGAIIANEKMNYFALISIADVVLKLIIVTILPNIDYDKLIFYGILSLSINFLDFFFYFFYSKRKFNNLLFEFRINKKLFKEMLTFSGWNIFESLAYTLKGQGLNILLNAFFGPLINAAKGISNQVSTALQGFQSNVIIAFKPQLTEAYAINDKSRVLVLMYSISKISYIILYMLIIPVLIELNYILNLWLKGTVPIYTISFIFIALIEMLISSLNTPLSQVVQASGNLKIYQITRSILITATLPISWIILQLGANPTSVFIISLLITLINQPLSMYLLKKIFNYSYKEYLKIVIYPCLIFTFTLPCVPLLIHFTICESLLRLFLVSTTSLLCTLVLSYLFLLDKNEKFLLTHFWKKISNFLTK